MSIEIYTPKLVRGQQYGHHYPDEIMQWFDEVREHQDFSKDYLGLADFRKAVLAMPPEGNTSAMVKKASALSKYMIDKDFTTAKWAILTNAPIETSLMMVYSNRASQKHPVKIFFQPLKPQKTILAFKQKMPSKN